MLGSATRAPWRAVCSTSTAPASSTRPVAARARPPGPATLPRKTPPGRVRGSRPRPSAPDVRSIALGAVDHQQRHQQHHQVEETRPAEEFPACAGPSARPQSSSAMTPKGTTCQSSTRLRARCAGPWRRRASATRITTSPTIRPPAIRHGARRAGRAAQRVVGAHHDRGAARYDVAEQRVEERAALVVERGVGLVEQPQLGAAQEQPREAQATALAGAQSCLADRCRSRLSSSTRSSTRSNLVEGRSSALAAKVRFSRP
jgi:hypothetical protein